MSRIGLTPSRHVKGHTGVTPSRRSSPRGFGGVRFSCLKIGSVKVDTSLTLSRVLFAARIPALARFGVE
jgi:hypothetical protein